ncbi:hypothetical protein GLYMA_14G135500v4 [Glycine max]|uniref:HAT C-terminal dimerisation domain-containing protein n=1 Tax=Glycine max TaxID=3847 RepID=A0A0R0GCP0_SOYBN|nr:hypothetical protein GYH30_039875 [Glycine max]KRH16145.1 hypothetical protein GLYMA_14G135500v4 [Glycine max]
MEEKPSLSRPSPSTSSPHPSLLISNPISLTSSIGLQEPHPQSLKASLYGDGSVSTSHSRPPSLLRPSPSTSSLLPSLLISNPNISLTSLIGLQASPSVTHCLPLWRWLRVSLTLTASLHGSASSSSSPSRQTLISETVRLCANTYLISHTDLIEYKEQVASDIGKSQLDTYLEEAALNLHLTTHMDVLDWCETNSPRFPHLSIMSCDLLSIPVTTVASESVFSIGSHILNKYGNLLSSNCVEAIICTRNWKHGFNEDDDDLFDEDSIVKTTSSKGASNVVDVEENDNE